jgi:Recombination endonuclease VII
MARKNIEDSRAYDRERHRKYMNEWRRKHGDDYRTRYRVGQLKRKYGLTLEQFENLFKRQKEQCAACGEKIVKIKSNSLHVDHCHKNNLIRGILCGACNRTIGHAKESISRLMACALYLQRYHDSIEDIL